MRRRTRRWSAFLHSLYVSGGFSHDRPAAPPPAWVDQPNSEDAKGGRAQRPAPLRISRSGSVARVVERVADAVEVPRRLVAEELERNRADDGDEGEQEGV